MSLDITPSVAPGRLLVQSYGDDQFRINGQSIPGSVILCVDDVQAWPVQDAQEISLENLKPVFDKAADLDMLLIGCGADFMPPPKGLRDQIRECGLVLEWMDTGAACRTYNVLLLEDRQVAAALIVVP